MGNTIYETYPIKDSLLPFHFHLENMIPNLYYPNWHEGIELLYCISGKGKMRCGGDEYDFQKNDLICINSKWLHSSSTDDRISYYCLIVDPGFCRDNGINISKLNFEALIKDNDICAKYERLIEVYSVYKNAETKRSLMKAEIRLCVLELLIALCKNHLISDDNSYTSHKMADKYTKKVLEYITENISENLSIDDISRHVGVSKYHLLREFKLITGHSIVTQINILKCNEAKKMIEEGKTIKETAIALGFNNISYFSQLFKKYYGVSPTKAAESTVVRL